MKPERWKRVNALLSAALERKGEQRAAFLVHECEGDEELQKQVQALLRAYEAASSFLEAPPSDAAGALLGQTANVTSPHAFTGRVLSHYRLEELIGAGGILQMKYIWNF